MAGNVDTRTEIIPATGVVQLPNANFLFIVSSTGNVALQLKRQGLRPGAAQENYSGQIAGLQISRTNAWDFASLTGTPGVTVTFIYGNVAIRDDSTLFNQQIAVISGVTAVATQPASVISDTAAVNAVNAAQTVIVPQNLARRRVTLGSPSNNTGVVFIRKTGGAQQLLELQPGTFVEFDGTYGIDVRNDSGATQLITVFEET